MQMLALYKSSLWSKLALYSKKLGQVGEKGSDGGNSAVLPNIMWTNGLIFCSFV